MAAKYTTDFRYPEEPISEGGNWINGKVVGLDWCNCATTNGMVQGRQNNGSGPSYNDSTALLTGTWGSNQSVNVKLYKNNVVEGDYPEVEIRLRSKLSAHVCSGYEALWSLRSDYSCYVSIIRWDGEFGDFVGVSSVSGAQYALTNGTILKASIVGRRITMYVNGIAVLAGNDTTYTDGNPGVGFDHNGPRSEDAGFGFTSFTATDDLGPVDSQPPVVTLISPTAGETVSNTVQLVATATDDVGVGGVQFLVDGENLGGEVLAEPYSIVWETAAAINGSHLVQVIATDWAGNRTTNSISVTVRNVFSAPPTDRLVAAYAFEEGSGTTTGDMSNNGNTASINGAAWTYPGKHGRALSFSGRSTVSVSDSSSLDLTNGMTLEAWTYPIVAVASWSTLIMKETFGSLIYSLQCTPGGRLSVYITTVADGLEGIEGHSALPLNTWSHVAGTYDGARLRLYINGDEITNAPFSSDLATSTGAVRMGGNSVWGEYFTGMIDDVRIHSRALSRAEILSDIQTPVGGFPSITLQVPVQTAGEIAQNGFRFHLNASSATSGTIEYTTNLSAWVQLATFQYTNHQVEMIDPSPAGRFYRARQR
jgi:hypothetical protein